MPSMTTRSRYETPLISPGGVLRAPAGGHATASRYAEPRHQRGRQRLRTSWAASPPSWRCMALPGALGGVLGRRGCRGCPAVATECLRICGGGPPTPPTWRHTRRARRGEGAREEGELCMDILPKKPKISPAMPRICADSRRMGPTLRCAQEHRPPRSRVESD